MSQAENFLQFIKIASQHQLYHATSKDNFTNILDSGKLLRTQDLPEDVQISKERFKGIALRVKGKAKDLKGAKNADKIFFSKGGYDKRYGDYIFAKELKKVTPHDKFTLIPNEFTYNKGTSVRFKTKIFVPDAELPE
jgi:hypothetical protein